MRHSESHKRVRLKYRAQIDMGQSPPSVEYVHTPEEGIPFLQGTADFGQKIPIPSVYCATPSKIAKKGDILFSVRAPVGELNVANQEMGIGRGLCAIRAGDTWLPRFGWWALHEARYQLDYVSSGSTYEAVSTEDVANLLVEDCDISEQRAIADYLDHETAQIDALISAKEQMLILSAEKRRALISHAVARGLNPDIPLRDSSVPWLGKIPAHWNQCHLKRVLSSMDYGISSPVNPSGEIAVIRMGDIRDGEIDYSNVGFVDEVDKALLLRPDDLLFNRTNSLDQIGKVAIFRGMPDYPTSFASYLVRFRCKPNILPEFLNWLLNSTLPVAWGRAEALPAIGQVNLNPNRYGYLPIALPPIREQKEIAQHISELTRKIDAVRNATERTIAQLKERRSALIAAAVTGQISIEGVA